MDWCRRWGLGAVGSVALCLFVGARAAAQPGKEVSLPPAPHDPGKGLIDGKAAVGFWPGTSSAMDRKPADPAGFEAHIALRDALETETVRPAGEWFFPPWSGAFLAWLESPARSLISPSPTPVVYR